MDSFHLVYPFISWWTYGCFHLGATIMLQQALVYMVSKKKKNLLSLFISSIEPSILLKNWAFFFFFQIIALLSCNLYTIPLTNLKCTINGFSYNHGTVQPSPQGIVENFLYFEKKPCTLYLWLPIPWYSLSNHYSTFCL